MHRSLSKRVAAAVIALAIAAPAAWAASSGSPQVHTQTSRGTISVSGYDGGVSLTSANGH